MPLTFTVSDESRCLSDTHQFVAMAFCNNELVEVYEWITAGSEICYCWNHKEKLARYILCLRSIKNTSKKMDNQYFKCLLLDSRIIRWFVFWSFLEFPNFCDWTAL